MNVKTLLVFIAILVPAPAIAENFKYTVNEPSRRLDIRGVGEYVLRGDQTLREAYAAAESIAKLDASKKMGEYIEVLKLTDTETGEVKEIVASVSATVMSYDVIEKTTKHYNGEIIAYVEIVAKVEPGELEAAMDRYFDSVEYKKALDDVNSEKNQLQALLLEKEQLVAEMDAIQENLLSDLRKSSEKHVLLENNLEELKISLNLKTKRIEDKIEAFESRIINARKFKSINISKQSGIVIAKKEALELEDEYLKMLSVLLDNVNYRMQKHVTYNPMTGVQKVMIIPTWTFPEKLVRYMEIGEYDQSYSHKDYTYRDNISIYAYILGSEPLDLLSRKYAIIYKVMVNDKVLEIPVLMPVQVDSKLKRPEQCSLSEPLTDGHGLNYSCFNFEFYPQALIDGHTISHEYINLGDELYFEFSGDDEVVINASFEIRELSSGRVLFDEKI